MPKVKKRSQSNIILPFNTCSGACVWEQSNAHTDSEVGIGWVKSEEECLSMYYAQCEYKGYNMANIEYFSDNNSQYIGTCWCQNGKDLIVDLNPCCKTVWAASCDIPGIYSEIH